MDPNRECKKPQCITGGKGARMQPCMLHTFVLTCHKGQKCLGAQKAHVVQRSYDSNATTHNLDQKGARLKTWILFLLMDMTACPLVAFSDDRSVLSVGMMILQQEPTRNIDIFKTTINAVVTAEY